MYQQTFAAPPPPFQAQPFPPQPFAAQPFSAQASFPPPPGFGSGPGMPPQGFGPGPGQPFPPFPPAPGADKQKKMIFIGVGAAVAVIALALILWATGVFGGGSSWIQGRWCAADQTSLTFASSGTVTSSTNPVQPSTYKFDGTTLTITGPQGQPATFTVTKTDSSTMSLGALPMRRC